MYRQERRRCVPAEPGREERRRDLPHVDPYHRNRTGQPSEPVLRPGWSSRDNQGLTRDRCPGTDADSAGNRTEHSFCRGYHHGKLRVGHQHFQCDGHQSYHGVGRPCRHSGRCHRPPWGQPHDARRGGVHGECFYGEPGRAYTEWATESHSDRNPMSSRKRTMPCG